MSDPAASLDAGGAGAAQARSINLIQLLVRLVKGKPLGAIGGVITLVLLFTGLFADVLAPFGMNETDKLNFLAPPSAQYWLGTDHLGRDMLSRIIFGARVSVVVGLTSSVITVALAVFIGVLSGYIGGPFDLMLQRVVDAVMALPGLVLLLVIISMVGPGMWSVIVTLGVLGGISSSRIIRSAVIGIKENAYVAAAQAIGCRRGTMFLRHLLPNIMAPIIILFSLNIPGVILSEASLSFLGFGIPAPQPSWGAMLGGKARPYMMSAPWMVLWPGIALAVVVFGTNIFGDALRDLLDPRLRGGAGRFGIMGSGKDLTKALRAKLAGNGAARGADIAASKEV